MKNQLRKKIHTEVSPAIFDTRDKVRWVCECGEIKYFGISTRAVICACGGMMKREDTNESN